jgi:hypothetical protein
MAAIQKKLILLASILSALLLLFIFIVIRSYFVLRIRIPGAAFPLLLVSNILMIMLFRQHSTYNTVRLITENVIIHIEYAKVKQESNKGNKDIILFDGIDAFISCFGVLLGSTVIKFNMDGIRLKDVQVTDEFISLVYGTDKNTQSIKLFHGIMDKQEIARTAERFRYETGIVPTIINQHNMPV